MRLVTFVIPVYRNQDSLKKTYLQNVNTLMKLSIKYKYEFVFVDDGSDDNSAQELLKLRKKDKRVKIIQFSRNFGQKSAVVAGLRNVKKGIAICMSADLQDDPNMIPKMIRAYEDGSDIVVCYRKERDERMFKKFRSLVYYKLLSMTYPNIPKGGFDYFMLSGKPLKAYRKLKDRNRVTQVDVLWLGFNIKFIPYKRKKRSIGKSQYNFSKYLKSFIDGVLDGSYIPIRMMSLAGFVSAFIGFLYVFVIVYRFLNNETPFEGYAPIVILVLIIGGLIMLMLGVLGEYIWRIYNETRKRPMYIIKNKFF